MIRIRALNEESSEESQGEEEIPTITREAQEQAAFSQYNKALVLMREKNVTKAKGIIQELLDSDFLVKASKEDCSGQPSVVLKYSCLKNMGSILEQEDLEEALKHYLQAAELDSSDVHLWIQMGTVAIKTLRYELACEAFLEGLRCSPWHAQCLDNLVTIFYALNDYISCLFHIAIIFKQDSNCIKGLAFRDRILEEQPSVMQHFNLFYKNHDLGPLDAEYDREIGKQLVEEALALREARRSLINDLFIHPPLQPVSLVHPPSSLTWLAFGQRLLSHYKLVISENMSMCHPLKIEVKEALVSSNLVSEEKPKQSGENPCEENIGDKKSKVDDGECETAVEKGKKGNEWLGESGIVPDKAKKNGDWQCEITSMANDQLFEAVDTPGQPDEETKSRRRRRNSLSFLAQWVYGGKRRSARVRSTVRREAERDECNPGEALRRLVPRSLLPSTSKDEKGRGMELKSCEDSLDTMDLYKLFEHRENSDDRGEEKNNLDHKPALDEKGKSSDYFTTKNEATDIEDFISRHNYQTIVEVLTKFVHKLSQFWDIKWPKELVVLYLEAYQCMRQHVPHPAILTSEADWDVVINDAWSTLLYEELSLNMWLEENCSGKETECDMERPLPGEALTHLFLVSLRMQLETNFLRRLYWLKAHAYLSYGEISMSRQSLQRLLLHFEDHMAVASDEKVVLANCSQHNIISRESVKLLVVILTRNQNLCEVQHLYDEEHYEELVEILQETFRYGQQPNGYVKKSGAVNCPDRETQLAMLMDALWQLKRYQECFFWGEACCNEAFHKYLNSEDKEQQKWASTIEKLLAGLESCITKAGLSVVDGPRLPRLVQNLTHMICHQLEAPETAVEMPIESVIPWILLQQILERQEEKEPSQSGLEEDNDGEEDLPGYVSILFTAHDYLSRRSWCCSNEGALLLHAMDVVIPRMRNPELSNVREKLVQGMEQVFYCLYGHPSKKTKVRSSVQDHSVPQVTLTWERALQLCQFYQPEELPEFDSYRVGSITADVEVLFRRVAGLIPDNCNPVLLVDRMNQYIEGELPNVPRPPCGHVPLPRSVSSIFYLLADFYFKNNEWAKAIRHYLLDVCVNPVRLDSWAGMALARGSQLETKLNSCEMLKSEADFLRKAACTKRCFQRSLDIDSSHSLLWIEYGSFVYMMHSFCSRLLKQETYSLSLEMFDVLEVQKEQMLDLAVHCFSTANKVWYKMGEDSGLQDERWLHHYMLGKVAEKRDQQPAEYLDHYAKANNFLYRNGASYARKISYNNPQNLAVEALEIFYRTHACILKWLEQNEGRHLDRATLALFQRCLLEAADGPFMAKNGKDCDGRGDSDEDKLKRPANERPEEAPSESKRPRLDQPVDFSMMEDVIDVMEDIIGKVAEDAEVYILPNLSSNEKVSCDKNSVPEDHIMEVVISDDDTQGQTVKKSKSLLNSTHHQAPDVKNTSKERIEDVFSDDTECNGVKDDHVTNELQSNCSGDDKMITHISLDHIGRPLDSGEEKLNVVESNEDRDKVNSEVNLSKSGLPVQHSTEGNKSDVSATRRSSQESMTTTTTTETSTSAANSSSSSENDSSSSSDDSSDTSNSSDSGDSSDSDSDDANQSVETVMQTSVSKEKSDMKEGEKAQEEKPPEEDQLKEEDGMEVYGRLVKYCLIALEECILRFPQHYKSLYRLTHYYFRSKLHRDVPKCRELLLGSYMCQATPGRRPGITFQGLFAERKNNNFFNGVWRIPVSEVDRPGSFASHMSRCVSLLMDVLQELRDHRMLLELCLQLRRTPDPDKKYLRDSEREQLSTEALSLSLQTLRIKLGEECSSALVLDVYRAYQRVQKHLPQKEVVFSSLLTEAYKKYMKVETSDLEHAIRFCQLEISSLRAAALASLTTPTNPVNVATTTGTAIASTSTVPVVTTACNITTTTTIPDDAVTITAVTNTTVLTSTTSTITTVPPVTTSINFSAAQNLQLSSQYNTSPASGKLQSVTKSSASVSQSTRVRGRPPGSTKASRSGEDVPYDYSNPKSATKSPSRNVTIPKVQQQQQQMAAPLLHGLPPPLSPLYSLHPIFAKPDIFAAALHTKVPPAVDPQMAFKLLQARLSGYRNELFHHFTSNALGSMSQVPPALFGSFSLPHMTGGHLSGVNFGNSSDNGGSNSTINNSNTSASASQLSPTNAGYMKDRPNISITPVSQSSNQTAVTSNPNSVPMQHKVSGKSSSSTKSSPQKNSSSSIPASTSLGSKDKKYSSSQARKSPNASSYMSFLKHGEGMLTNSISISQVPPVPTCNAPTKSTTAKLLNVRKGSSQNVLGQDGMGKGSNHSLDTVANLTLSKCNYSLTRGQNNDLFKGQPTEVSGQNTQFQKGQAIEAKDSSYKGVQAQGNISSNAKSSTSLRNIGHEITVMSSSQAQSGISMLNRLQQQSSHLEIIPKSKSDVPISIPSSITITPKQASCSDSGFRNQQAKQSSSSSNYRTSGMKPKETAASVIESGSSPKNKSNMVKRTLISSKKQADEPKAITDTNVEVITLE